MTISRSAQRRNGIYSKALKIGFQMGIDAAKRDAELCRLSWDGEARAAAGVIADQINKLEVSEDAIQQMVDERNAEKPR